VIKNLILDRPVAVLDLQIAGTDPKATRIIEIRILRLVPGPQPDHRTKRANPGIAIPAATTAIHRIRDEHVADLPPFRPTARSG